MTPEQGIQHFSSKEERDKIVFCAVLGPLIKGGKNQILPKLSPRDRRPSGHLVSLEHSDGSPGPQWPYLMSTGMSQLGGSRICLLAPSASQTCLPDCLLEPGWSLERVPEQFEVPFVALGHKGPFMCLGFAGKGSVPAQMPDPLSKGDAS